MAVYKLGNVINKAEIFKKDKDFNLKYIDLSSIKTKNYLLINNANSPLRAK